MSMTKMDNACDAAWDLVTLDGRNQAIAEATTVGNTAIDLLQYLVDHCDLSKVVETFYTEGYHEKQLIEINNLLQEWN
jgi:hypothetical protein